jgi:hypothetical protein
MEEIVVYVISMVVLYPLGVIRLWTMTKFKTSILKIVRSYSIKHVKEQGKIAGLHVVAFTGSVVLIVMLVLCIGSFIWAVSHQLFV